MKKENILYCIIGVLLGFIAGFMFANTTNERGYAARAFLARLETASPRNPALERLRADLEKLARGGGGA
jgi:hypothetical protein